MVARKVVLKVVQMAEKKAEWMVEKRAVVMVGRKAWKRAEQLADLMDASKVEKMAALMA